MAVLLITGSKLLGPKRDCIRGAPQLPQNLEPVSLADIVAEQCRQERLVGVTESIVVAKSRPHLVRGGKLSNLYFEAISASFAPA